MAYFRAVTGSGGSGGEGSDTYVLSSFGHKRTTTVSVMVPSQQFPTSAKTTNGIKIKTSGTYQYSFFVETSRNSALTGYIYVNGSNRLSTSATGATIGDTTHIEGSINLNANDEITIRASAQNGYQCNGGLVLIKA